MKRERRHGTRQPCKNNVGIYLARAEDGSPCSAVLPGNIIDISPLGARLSLPQIFDRRVHLVYTAMESQELILHIVVHHSNGQESFTPVKPIWFNRRSADSLSPFRLGVEFTPPLRAEQLTDLLGA